MPLPEPVNLTAARYQRAIEWCSGRGSVPARRPGQRTPRTRPSNASRACRARAARACARAPGRTGVALVAARPGLVATLAGLGCLLVLDVRLREHVRHASQETLGREGVELENNFFDLGGHSLLVAQVVGRIRDAFEVDLPMRKMFENPTVARLAAAVEERLVETIQTLSDAEAERLATAPGEKKT